MGDDPAAALAGYAPCVPHLQVLNQCSDKYKEQQQALQTPEPSTPDPGPDTLPPTTESGVVPTYIQEEPVILVLGGPGVDATLPPIGIVSNSPSGSSGSPKPECVPVESKSVPTMPAAQRGNMTPAAPAAQGPCPPGMVPKKKNARAAGLPLGAAEFDSGAPAKCGNLDLAQNKIRSAYDQTMQNAAETAKQAEQALKDAFESARENAMQAAQQAQQTAKDGLETVRAKTAQVIQVAEQKLQQGLAEVQSETALIAELAQQAMQQGYEQIRLTAQKCVRDVKSTVEEASSTVRNEGASAVSIGSETIIEMSSFPQPPLILVAPQPAAPAATGVQCVDKSGKVVPPVPAPSAAQRGNMAPAPATSAIKCPPGSEPKKREAVAPTSASLDQGATPAHVVPIPPTPTHVVPVPVSVPAAAVHQPPLPSANVAPPSGHVPPQPPSYMGPAIVNVSPTYVPTHGTKPPKKPTKTHTPGTHTTTTHVKPTKQVTVQQQKIYSPGGRPAYVSPGGRPVKKQVR